MQILLFHLHVQVGIETKFKHNIYPDMIYPPNSVHTLYKIVATEFHLVVGACSSLSNLQRV